VDIEFGRVVDALAGRGVDGTPKWPQQTSPVSAGAKGARLLRSGRGATFTSAVPRAHASAADAPSLSVIQTRAVVDALARRGGVF